MKFLRANKLLVVLILAAALIFLAGSNIPNLSVARDATEPLTPTPTPIPTATPTPVPSPSAVEIQIDAGNFYYSKTEIRVRRGDQVTIAVANVEGMHDLVIDEYNVRTPQINAGETSVVEFTADRPGVFDYYCSVGNHRQMGMLGKLIVE